MRDGVIFGLHIRSDTAPFSATGLRQIIRTFTQWGALPFPLQPLTAHSLSRRVRDLLAGDLGAHRHLPVDRDQDAEAATPRQVPVVERRVFEEAEARRGWARRRADLNALDMTARGEPSAPYGGGGLISTAADY
jgi:hypothetical protein